MSQHSFTESDFDRIRNELHSDPEDLMKALNHNEHALQDYLRRYRDQIIAKSQQPARLLPQQTIADFFGFIATTNFQKNSTAALLNLEELVARKKFAHIGIGEFRGAYYRLRPKLAVLTPVWEPEEHEWKPNGALPFEAVLGVNWNVPYDSEPSGKNALQRGSDTTGFAFMQLGKAEYVLKEEWEASKDPHKLNWRDSDYVVVVEVNDDGRPGEVWMLYDYYPEDPIDGSRTEVGASHKECGKLYGCHKRITAFKICDSFLKIRDDAEFFAGHDWDQAYDEQNMHHQQFQIVNATYTRDHQLVRYSVLGG